MIGSGEEKCYNNNTERVFIARTGKIYLKMWYITEELKDKEEEDEKSHITQEENMCQSSVTGSNMEAAAENKLRIQHREWSNDNQEWVERPDHQGLL
jgi:hypothetical protein